MPLQGRIQTRPTQGALRPKFHAYANRLQTVPRCDQTSLGKMFTIVPDGRGANLPLRAVLVASDGVAQKCPHFDEGLPKTEARREPSAEFIKLNVANRKPDWIQELGHNGLQGK